MICVDNLFTMSLNPLMPKRRTDEDVRIQAEFIRLLKRELEKQDLSRAELARRFGCSKAWISQIMKNTRGLSLGDLWKIAGLLGISPAELLPLDQPPAEVSESIDALIERKVQEVLAKAKK